MNYEYVDLEKHVFILHGKSSFDNVLSGKTAADVIAEGGEVQRVASLSWIVTNDHQKPVQLSTLYVIADYAEFEAAIDRAVSAAYNKGVERGLSGD